MALKDLNEPALALKHFNESLTLRQRVANVDRGDVARQLKLFGVLYLISTVSDAMSAKAALGKALTVLESLEREHKLTDTQVGWPKFIRAEIAKLP